jgi:hypothetical protein
MYQPEMTEENVRRLYYLKLEKRRPMTKLLNEILNEYFEKHEKGGDQQCTNVNSAGTLSKSNAQMKARTTTTSDSGTARSAGTNMTS